MTSKPLAVIPLLVLQADPQRPVFRAATEVVQIDVFVGRNGKAILGLDRDDFVLRDQGERQDIELMDVASVPLNTAIVLDSSRSVAGEELKSLQEGVHAFVDGLAEGDRAALITFSQSLMYRAELTASRAELHAAVDAVEPSGATAWHDALFAALKIVEDVPDRPGVLLFTDGADTYSWLLDENLLPLVEQSRAVLYAITPVERRPAPGTAFSAERSRWRAHHEERSRRTSLLRQLTEASGGRLIEAPSLERLREVFVEILGEMKTRYLLSYQPHQPISEGWHDIEVEVAQRGVEVRARRGYFYEGSP